MADKGNGCALITGIGFVLYLIYQLLDFLLFSESQFANLLGVGIIIFIVGWLFWFFSIREK